MFSDLSTTTFLFLSAVCLWSAKQAQAGVLMDAWHLDTLDTLVNEELDPIVNPNGQGTHMHRVLGGSNFGASYNYANQVASSCTTAAIQADKSNYWMPQLYYITDPAHPSTTTFIPMRTNTRFYYFLPREDPSVPVMPFPEGLRMLIGSPDNKSPVTFGSFTCQTNAAFTNSILADNFNFANPCSYGMKTEVTFPSCWDGANLYKSDGSHMAYPYTADNDMRSGYCPWTHPYRVPVIMLEYTWLVQTINTNNTNLAGHLTWSNGDTTGYGIHADFVNGWDTDVLTTALNSTGCVGIGSAIPMTQCPYLAARMDNTAAANCKPAKGTLKEPYGNADGVAVPRLPGCNLLWGATGAKPTCNPPVAPLDVTAFKGTDGSLVPTTPMPVTFSTAPGWHYFGCINDATNQSALSGGPVFADARATPERCNNACDLSGYQYAALQQQGSGFQCVCANTLYSGATMAPGACTSVCPGNSSETCGGNYIFSLYYQNVNEVGADPKASYIGCYALPYSSSSPGLTTYATVSSANSKMTVEMCNTQCKNANAKWSAVKANQCFCGTEYNLGTGYYMPDDYCTVACPGNSAEICGDYYRVSVYNMTNWSGSSSASAAASAASKVSSSTTLKTSTTSKAATSSSSTAKVSSSVKPSSSSSSSLHTSASSSKPTSTLKTSSTAAAAASNIKVDLAASGMVTVTRTTSSAATASPTVVSDSRVGCYSSNVLSNDGVSSNSMTVDACRWWCQGMGYKLAGLSGSTTCYCGSSVPAGETTSTGCTSVCAGDATSYCGGYSAMAVYNSSSSASCDL